MLEQIAQKIQEVVNAETAVVSLAESSGTIVYHAAAIGKYAEKMVGLRANAATSGICGCTFQNACPVLVEKTQGDTRVRQDYAQAWGIKTALAVPLIYQGELLGAFMALNRLDGLEFNSEDEKKLVDYADSTIESIYKHLKP